MAARRVLLAKALMSCGSVDHGASDAGKGRVEVGVVHDGLGKRCGVQSEDSNQIMWAGGETIHPG